MTKTKIIIISAIVVILAAAGTTFALSQRNNKVKEQEEIEVKQPIKTKTEIFQTNTSSVSDNTAPEKEKEGVTSENTEEEPSIKNITVDNLKADCISVSCIKVTWDAEEKRDYNIRVNTEAAYTDNITLVKEKNGVWYITGLRECSDYTIVVEPTLMKNEKEEDCNLCFSTVTGRTERTNVLMDYEVPDGNTACFSGKKASELSEPITDAVTDPITETGIIRNQYGDYCCSMGAWYGTVGDRFLVELENGVQFTVMICDNKGEADSIDSEEIPDGRFNWFDGVENGKCVIEFIYDDNSLPDGVASSGNWGMNNWNGLNLSANIMTLKKISNGNPIQY